MGVFANTALRESYEYAPDVLREVSIRKFDPCETLAESGVVAVMESNQEWNQIMNEMAAKEYAVLESTGQEMVYEAVDIRGFFQKVKDWFKKLWSKIAGLFEKLLSIISSKVNSDKTFLKKYEDKIKSAAGNLKSEGFSFKGYPYTNIRNGITYNKDIADFAKTCAGKASSDAGKALNVLNNTINKANYLYNKGGADSSYASADSDKFDEVKKAFEKINDNREKTLNYVRGAVAGKDEEVSAGDFKKKLQEILRGKEFTTYKGDGEISVGKIIEEIKVGKLVKEVTKLKYQELKNTINIAIKKIDIYAKSISSVDNDANAERGRNLAMRAANTLSSLMQSIATIYQTANSVHIAELNKFHSMCKSLAVKIMENGKLKLESASSDYEDLEDLMEF